MGNHKALIFVLENVKGNKMIKNIITLTAAMSLAGCASTSIDNDSASQIISNPQLKRELPKASLMPTKAQLVGKQLKVLVLDAEERNDLAKSSFAGSAMIGSLDNLLHQAGVELVDRSIATKVKNEIIAYETSGEYDSPLLDLVDVSILPVITSATFNYEFKEGHEAKNIITGKQTWVKPSCSFKATVAGVAKTYKLPELKLASQVELSGVSEISRDARSSSCKISTNEKQGLIAQAAKQSIRNYKQIIQNEFSPKGYVIQYKVLNEKHFIQINIGENKKLVEGSSIQFVKQVKNTNDLTGESSIDNVTIGEGDVTNLIQTKTAWVNVEPEVASRLSLGDIAQVEFKKGAWDYLNDANQAIKSL
ncbi:hypothetical protein [Thalassotalea sp. PLHSN55]|uniref:hypothetical protein n=1 Tax=Thalassotalea sp. PLHSN55 TaxID=3435888 RepID=UPI003F852AA0